MLAGLALLYTHHHDLTPLVAVLTIAQQQTLATALGLDFQAHGTDASWPVLLARHIVSFQAPGQTPKKRKPAPDVFERRYARFARVLPAGRAREEILANIARQFGEMRTYFAALDSSLADCASRLEYHQQARWVGVRVHALFAPAVPRILATDGDDVDDGSVAPAGGAGGYPISPAAPSPAGKSPKGILKSQPPEVSFADGAPPPAYNVHAPVYFSPLAAAPAPAAPSWPPFYPQVLLFADSGGPARAAPPSYLPSLTGPGAADPESTPGPTPLRPRRLPPPPGHQRLRSSRNLALRLARSGERSNDKPAFLSQPMHSYVSGNNDLGVVPAGDGRDLGTSGRRA